MLQGFREAGLSLELASASLHVFVELVQSDSVLHIRWLLAPEFDSSVDSTGPSQLLKIFSVLSLVNSKRKLAPPVLIILKH